MTILPIALALVISVIGIALFARAIGRIVGVVKVGQPTLGRADDPASRWKTLLVESFGHTRMLKWSKVGIAHWFVFVGFMFLFFTLVTAFGQLFDPHFALPIIGHFFLYEWITEALAWIMLACIAYLIANRLNITGKGANGARGRFFGSRSWQAYYVEFTILGIGLCIIVLRALEYQVMGDRFHFPLSWFLLPAMSKGAAEVAIVWVAALKIIVSMAWFCVIGLNTTMGVAWHRFTAWPNIWFKREASGAPALGAIPPVNVGGQVPNLTDEDEMDEEVFGRLGVGQVEDFSWKGLLDFTSCTECGRCQSQCPAWNTEKPLSPKLLMMGLREHAYAKAPYLQAAESARESLAPELLVEAGRPLVGATVGADASEGDARAAAAAQAHGNPISVGADGTVAVVDADVLWSCTSCGACVQQCPVDIEHVDHIMDMRRFQVMVEGEFPTELNGLYKGLESKGNPWNMNRKGRLDWAKDLPFDVPVAGESVGDLTEVEYLFWVGCAGAYEDRAKKTTQAVAELLNVAGVTFAVLGNGETCTGDPARRSGNEMVFQQLAAENKETLTEARASKVVTTCAHCLNTLKNEYPQIGVELEVVHHTQLLNRLVRDGRLTPVAAPSGEVAGRTITYHDPCYLGRHNKVYDAPRDLLGAIPGATYAEMPRAKETSFCCGAGGARMWMEEKIGTRINVNRTSEALTVLGQAPSAAVATGCPFCRVMISDGLTAEQAEGRGENVEVLDVAQLLLEGVRRGQPDAIGSELSEEVATVSKRDDDASVSERADRVEEPVSPDHAEEATEDAKREADAKTEPEQEPAVEVDAPGEAPQAKQTEDAEQTEQSRQAESKETSGKVASGAAAGGAALGAISLKDLASKAKGGESAETRAAKTGDSSTDTGSEASEPSDSSQAQEQTAPKPSPTGPTGGAISLKDLAAKAKGSPNEPTPAPQEKDVEPAAETETPTRESEAKPAAASGAISLKDLAAKAKGGSPAQPEHSPAVEPDTTQAETAKSDNAAEPSADESVARQQDAPDDAGVPAKPAATAAAGTISLGALAAMAKGGSDSSQQTEPEPADRSTPEPEPIPVTEPADAPRDAEAQQEPQPDVEAPDTAPSEDSAKQTAPTRVATGAISLSALAAMAKDGNRSAEDQPESVAENTEPEQASEPEQTPESEPTTSPTQTSDEPEEVTRAERPHSGTAAPISLADLAQLARERKN